MCFDAKPDWPFTPALLQVYVADADAVAGRARALGADVFTQPTDFSGNQRFARFRDPWNSHATHHRPDAPTRAPLAPIAAPLTLSPGPRLSHVRSNSCYAWLMSREVSVRDLRNHTSDVIAAVRAGERVSLTVNRLPVADIVPHAASPSPWVPSHSLRAILDEAGADPGLLTDLGGVREDLVDDA